jgi:mannobiose 2-epimerase
MNKPQRRLAHVILVAVTSSLAGWRCAGGPRPAPAAAAATATATIVPRDPALVARVGKLRARLTALGDQTFQFWRTHGPDRQYGGFYGTLDRQGNKIAPTDKGLIQTARHLWAMSMWYERKQPTPEVKALADGLHRFLMAHFYDPNAKEFHFTVTESGALIEPRKILAGQALSIYALSQYARAFGDAAAADQAVTTFRALDARTHDAVNGGYRQVNDAFWVPPTTEKETNTQVHLMEALTSLYAYRPDPLVRARLEELAAICADKLLQPAAGYVHRDFRADWTLTGTPSVSYGHDMETGWLLLEAARALGRPDDPKLVAAAKRMILPPASAGYDRAQGGYFEEGVPGGAPTKLEKSWWVQAEALLALWRAFALTGDPTLLDRFEGTLAFIENHQRDAQYGEWYWSVRPDGSLGEKGGVKGNAWKASYHTLRSLTFAEGWMKAWSEATGTR